MISSWWNQAIQRQASLTGQPHVNRPAVPEVSPATSVSASFPGLETFGTAIPTFRWSAAVPASAVQFFNAHFDSEGSEPEHQGFLAEGRNDPRKEFMDRLRGVLGGKGSIVAYNAGFEIGRLKECAKVHREFKPWVAGVERRVLDLLAPFRSFASTTRRRAAALR